MQTHFDIVATDCCEVCGSSVSEIINLPDFPLTDVFSIDGRLDGFPSFDQSLLHCGICGHAQLKNQLDPHVLYGQSYGFRTANSETATKGTYIFAKYLKGLLKGRVVDSLVEFGSNDSSLLQLLKPDARRLYGFDPVLDDSNPEDEQIFLSSQMIEDVELQQLIGKAPDVIVSQHTLEHVPHPRIMLEKLLHQADENTLFVFELPGIEPLIENLRLDQVFHQHVQYFSRHSLLTLIEVTGCELLDFRWNYHSWGAMFMVFRKKKAGSATKKFPVIRAEQLDESFSRFKQLMHITASEIDDIPKDKLFGYGAGFMLPVLGYHLGTDFSGFSAILDDDVSKNGIGYANLDVWVKLPRELDFEPLTIVLTAMDNRRVILGSLLKKQPKRIIDPLNII